jgi:hypothetical protein
LGIGYIEAHLMSFSSQAKSRLADAAHRLCALRENDGEVVDFSLADLLSLWATFNQTKMNAVFDEQ